MAGGLILTVKVKDTWWEHIPRPWGWECMYSGGQFVFLRCVRRHVMLMSVYLGTFDKQHRQGDGAVKCHDNKPWQLLKGLMPPRHCRFHTKDEWQDPKPGCMQPGTFEYAELQELFMCRDSVAQDLKLDCNQLCYSIYYKWSINEVSLRLIRNENTFHLHIDL